MDAWTDGVPATALREISALKELSPARAGPNEAGSSAPHAHIVELYDVFVSFSGNLYLVFELLDRDLKSALDPVRARGGLPPDVVRSYLFQLLLVRAPPRAEHLAMEDV